jgi:hypothetical protein
MVLRTSPDAISAILFRVPCSINAHLLCRFGNKAWKLDEFDDTVMP